MKFRVAIVLDRSGSMEGPTKSDHEGGIRSFIEDQKKQQGETKFTFVQFDTNDPFEVIYDDVDVQTVKSESISLIPRGGTPLLDAVGKTIAQLEQRELTDKSDQVILMIITDGDENSSTEWNREKLKFKIEEKKDDWQILFLGANIDSFSEAGSFGLSARQAINFNNAVGASVGNAYDGLKRKTYTARAVYADQCASGSFNKAALLNACSYDECDYAEQNDFVDNSAGISATNNVS